MTKKRILHVVTTMNYAGIETLLMNIYRNIDRTKVQFDFIVHTKEKGHYEDEIQELGGKIFRIEKYNVLNIKKYENDLYNFFKEHREYNIVHSHLNTFSKFVLKAAKKADVDFRIAHSHASMPLATPKTLVKYLTKLNINKYANYRLSCSEEAAKWLYGTTDNIIYFNNSIDTKKFLFNKAIRKNMRKELDIDKNTLLIGHVGNFFKAKNHSFIVELFSRIKERKQNTKLLLIGTGEQKVVTKKLVRSLNLEKDVIFLGSTDKVEDYMQAMDIFVFPSLREGLGIVTIEAQSAGLKTIVSENIPKETNISNLICYLPLNSKIDLWIEEVLKANINEEREDMYNIIQKSGFDIHDNTSWLQKFYLELRDI